MLIVVPVEEMDILLGETLGVLHECGFETMVVSDFQIKKLLRSVEKKIIVLGKHPNKKHNGESDHRRRFAFYSYCRCVQAVGYAEGIIECDNLWWKDLHHKISYIIRNNFSGIERYNLLYDLSKLSSFKIE